MIIPMQQFSEGLGISGSRWRVQAITTMDQSDKE